MLPSDGTWAQSKSSRCQVNMHGVTETKEASQVWPTTLLEGSAERQDHSLLNSNLLRSVDKKKSLKYNNRHTLDVVVFRFWFQKAYQRSCRLKTHLLLNNQCYWMKKSSWLSCVLLYECIFISECEWFPSKALTATRRANQFDANMCFATTSTSTWCRTLAMQNSFHQVWSPLKQHMILFLKTR